MDILNTNASTISFNILKYKFGENVELALYAANEDADGTSINVKNLLEGVLFVCEHINADDLGAFLKIGRMLRHYRDSKKSKFITYRDLPIKPDKPYVFTESLSQIFARAIPIFNDYDIQEEDIVTAALLAMDSSISIVLTHLNQSLKDLRDYWFNYLVANEKESIRSKNAYRWWKNENVPIPEERNVQKSENTYLVTWDPSRNIYARMNEVTHRIEQDGEAVMSWSVGGHGADKGDRILFMRHGKNRPGIVGMGHIVTKVFEDKHWDEKAPSDYTAFYATILWEKLQEYPIISLSKLIKFTKEENLWTKNGTGFPVSQKIANDIIELIKISNEIYSQNSTSISIPFYESDSVETGDYKPKNFFANSDSLEMNLHAARFASLLVAKDTQLPLAIGLLGDWGVGKSYFIRLIQENIKQNIEELDSSLEDEKKLLSRVVQIDFNAWHYMDSDLWASLASHIFESLVEHLAKMENKEVEEIRRELRTKIDSSVSEKKLAEEAIKSAQIEMSEAKNTLRDLETHRVKAIENLKTKKLERIWNSIKEIKVNLNDEQQEKWPDIKSVIGRVEETAKRLGITETINNANEVNRVQKSLKETLKRGNLISSGLMIELTGKRRGWFIIIIVLLFLLIIGWPLILEYIFGRLEFFEGSFKQIFGIILQISTLVMVPMAWISGHLKNINSAICYLEVVKKKLNEARKEKNEPTSEELDMLKNISEIESSIEIEQNKINLADRTIEEAQEEINRINSGGLVYDFLEGRVKDSNYVDRLGLISVIRKDFNKLGTLLRDWRKNPLVENSDENINLNLPEGWDSRPIERIVLYIDDLDRCPPSRVVEVLQAVHLLLAFDLFAVVVAVDARWLERALNEEYNSSSLIGSLDSLKKEYGFNPYNYLEKIFQIPFSLPKMYRSGFRTLVKSLVDKPSKIGFANEETRKGRYDKQRAFDKDESLKFGNEESIEKTNDVSINAKSSDLESVHRNSYDSTVRRIEAMQLSTPEINFIGCLGGFINTPRLTKRFINVYRLLRARALDLGNYDSFSSFIDKEEGEYRTVLLLLAINIWKSKYYRKIFNELPGSGAGAFREIFELIDYKEKKVHASVKSSDNKFIDKQELIDLSLVLQELQKLITETRYSLESNDVQPLDNRIYIYQRWFEEVGVYSFHW